MEFWDEGLESSIDELGEERWMVLEQVKTRDSTHPSVGMNICDSL